MEFQTIQAHIATQRNEEIEFLILKRSNDLKLYPGLWQVVTGTIEPEETAAITTIREVFEETGIKPLKLWYLPYVTSYYSPPKNKVLAAPVFGIFCDPNSGVKLSCEHQDYEWLDYNKAYERLALPGHKEAHRIFKDYILESELSHYYEINL